MFELVHDERASPTHTYPKEHLADYTTANMVPGIQALNHLKDHDHTKQVIVFFQKRKEIEIRRKKW